MFVKKKIVAQFAIEKHVFVARNVKKFLVVAQDLFVDNAILILAAV